MGILRRYLLLLLAAVAAAFLVFGGDAPPEVGAPDSRAFVRACEQGPYVAATAAAPVEAARLCACLLAWHLQEGGGRLPVAAYTAGPEPAGETDRRARAACLPGRPAR
ncbi:hypothetical protein [Azospirillum halopraeferens]|uniref:hypothetical protein n=1 Tax=Azospirillum halopraeferens TaxID=34010 RepID=UPI00040F1762|nr:hypothetical protein [Azospirillum halopraeferens]